MKEEKENKYDVKEEKILYMTWRRKSRRREEKMT